MVDQSSNVKVRGSVTVKASGRCARTAALYTGDLRTLEEPTCDSKTLNVGLAMSSELTNSVQNLAQVTTNLTGARVSVNHLKSLGGRPSMTRKYIRQQCHASKSTMLSLKDSWRVEAVKAKAYTLESEGAEGVGVELCKVELKTS